MFLNGLVLRQVHSSPPGPSSTPQAASAWKAIELLAETTPDMAAVISADGTLSYRQFWNASLDLAAAILELPCEGDGTVAIFAPQGAVHPQAQLACKMLGRICVPMDTGESTLYNQRIAALGRAEIIVCGQADESEARRISPRAHVIDTSRIRPGAGFRPPTAPLARQGGILLFTSGSTGLPKGIFHATATASVRYATAMDSLNLRPGDVAAYVSVPTTMLSSNLLVPPLAGAAVMLETPRSNPHDLLSRMRQHGAVTQLTCSVGFFRTLIQVEGCAEAFSRLRCLWLVAGAIFGRDIANIRRITPPDMVIGCSYSSSEAGRVGSLVVPARLPPDMDRLPIGDPPGGTELWLGCPPENPNSDTGELFVSNTRLIDGYWQDEETTAKAFHPHPSDPTRRIFRTGDLAQISLNGEITIVGRHDNQIKLRGWRIELEGLEAAALAASGVEHAGVTPRRDETGEIDTLVLYVSGETGTPSVAERAMEAIRASVPRPSWPTEAHVVSDFPLTRTGKIDRPRLAAMDADRRNGTQAPSVSTGKWADALSERIARIIAGELRADRFEPDQPFLRGYGDSLKALNISLHIERELRTTIDPAVLLDDTPIRDVVADIARQVQRAKADRGEA